MSLPPLLIQTAGSLVAILALAGLARWLQLGGVPRLASNADVARAAGEVEDGFTPVEIACDAEGAGALVRDQDGRIMLIRRHGNRFAGRVLTASASACASGHAITINCGERRFGTTRLELDEAQAWAEAINALSVSRDA
ncbi:MAG: hypothetical protein ACK4IS_12275 [Erythrobacter sp.]